MDVGIGGPWVWRYPGTQEQLIADFLAGRFPGGPNAPEDLEVVNTRQLGVYDQVILDDETEFTLYIGDDSWTVEI
ncbi:MAG: hypothetical protein EP330_20220 [Deltaproteobacteria bacterium]|nr:MAG: hypothetical protein EP330_20220 [Deltaproteobacteria bacterium]